MAEMLRVKVKIIMSGLIAAMLFIHFGCIPKQTQPKIIDCEPKPPLCQQQKWHGEPLDTSMKNAISRGYFFSLKPVQRINSPDEEWQLSFIDEKQAMITVSERGRQSAMMTRKIRHDSYNIESGVILPLDMHFGAISIYGNTAIFAASPREQVKGETDYSAKVPLNQDFTGKSRIYSAEIFGRELSKIRRISEIESDEFSWDSHPAFFNGGKAFVFASDRNGGAGYSDLWLSCKLSNGKWATPVNLGGIINTACDELTPFVDIDGRFLFFASAGHNTLGGYDLFKCEISPKFYSDLAEYKLDMGDIGKYFSQPENLKPPINSEFDELFPSSPSRIDSMLYFSSDRAGRENLVVMLGGFDLYVFCKEKYSQFEQDEIRERATPDIALKPGEVSTKEIKTNIVKNFTLEGSVFREGANEAVPEAEVTARSQAGDKTAKSGQDGKYSLNLLKDVDYEVTARADKYFHDTFKARVDASDTTSTFKRDFQLPVMLSLRVNFPTDEYQNPYKYTLDSNGVETGRTWQEELKLIAETILAASEKIQKILLSGHTDDVGTVEYNQKLGERRVNFVISELSKLGVPGYLLEGRSAGELEPLQQRRGEDISSFRKRLRRVTIEKILKD